VHRTADGALDARVQRECRATSATTYMVQDDLAAMLAKLRGAPSDDDARYAKVCSCSL